MKYILIILAISVLAGCSKSLVITDGEQDMLIGGERVKSGCGAIVHEDFVGDVTFITESCNVHVTNGVVE